MEMWAGFECTLNRVGALYYDQLKPHDRAVREACLRTLPDMGVSAFRYRIAWDDCQTPAHQVGADLGFLSEAGIEPIVGLLHHGSGPVGGDLLSPDFPAGLAEHARKTAERWPWVRYWTPVNEPLTTARFSALYGHWYPHRRSEAAFWLALVNQIDATRLAMAAIRKINPQAELVQTEDLGRTFGTAALTDQVAFDNQRRWMTWDLLTGAVVQGHPFYERLCTFNLGNRLRAIADDPCPPAIIGVDHYVTSDRMLDHRATRYPPDTRGGNGRQAYADVEAVRVLSSPFNGIEAALAEAWERFRLPVAVTECHIGCSRDEQMRWLCHTWDTALRLNSQGADIRAVTAWALLGARDWASLATTGKVDFECGAFDPRGGTARPTGLSRTIAALASGRPVENAATGRGWWCRDARLAYPSVPFARSGWAGAPYQADVPLLIAGASGTLGQALLKAARSRGLIAISTTRSAMALDEPATIAATLDCHQPWAVINATGYVNVDAAEFHSKPCWTSNVDGALNLARACELRRIPHASFSSDLVYDGKHSGMYCEDDTPAPLSVYGRSKAQADAALLQMPLALVIRTAAFFSPDDAHNFAHAVVETLRGGNSFHASHTHMVSPTYVPHLCDAVIDLLIDAANGLWHLSSGVELSWADFARRLASAADLDPQKVCNASAADLGWVAARPQRSGLTSKNGALLPSLDDAIAAFAQAAR